MKIGLVIIICILTICLIVYSYYGGFKRLNIQIAEQGGETVVYESIVGDYRQSGVVMDKIYYSLLNDNQIETFKGFGKYFDNPKKVEKSKLRSEAGCILSPKDTDKLLKTTGDFEIKNLPIQKYIVTEFPYKGKLSVLFSIMKVYPALSQYAKNNGFNEDGSIIEIYDIPNKTIFYRKEILSK